MSDEQASDNGDVAPTDEAEEDMHVHRPKPLHSWREFLVEIGTIICGIMIALGLEQAVTAFDWSRKVSETRQALAFELAGNLGRAEVRIELSDCIDRRLDALAGIVDRASMAGSLPSLPTPTSPPYYSWGTGVWSSAISAQTASHLPGEQLREDRRGRRTPLAG